MQDKSHYYRSLSRNIMLIMILVSFTPLVLVAGIIGYSFETSYREKVLAHLKELVQKHEQSINSFLDDKLSYIKVFATSFTHEQLSDEAFLAKKLMVLQQAYGGVYVDLGVVNEDGIQIAYAGAFRLEKADYSQAEWFKKAIRRDFFISDVFLGLRRQPHFIIASRQKWAGKEWIVRATIDFVAFNSLVESIHIGKTGLAFIVNRNGEFQTKPRLEPAANTEFFMNILKKSKIEPSKKAVGEGHEKDGDPAGLGEDFFREDVESGIFKFPSGDFVYVMTPLKNGEWVLAYQQDETDAFSNLYQARRLAFIICLLGGMAIVLMAFYLSRKMVQRVERADQEMDMMNEQVIETGKLASVGELAAGIAHEINNPVAIMVEEAGWIEDFLDDFNCANLEALDELKKSLKQIDTQGQRCKEITHKLLSFARKTDPNLRNVMLNDLIEELIVISEQKSKYGNVKIRSNLPPDMPMISASPSEMQQVFLNLINNAIDAIGPEGGTIDINSRIEGDYLVIDVSDTGQGIPKAIMARIFDPFFTTKPVGSGTGLGLSICYGIVNKMGGNISVNSAERMGTTFHVHLPLPKREESESED